MLLFVLAAAGCASGPAPDSAWPQPRPLGRKLEAFVPPRSADAPARGAGFEAPTGTLTLRDALAATLLGSPDLAATAYEVRAREAETLQAGLLPNPEIELELEEFGGSGDLSGFDSASIQLKLSQLIELGGKRIKRQRVAGYMAQSAGWDYEIRRIDVLSAAAADYVAVLAAQRRLMIARDAAELAQRVYDAVGVRVDAGKVPPVERTKAGVEWAQAQVGLQNAERTVNAARIRLASNWGSIEPQFDELAGDLDHAEPPPSLEALLARIEQNPDLARWTAEAALRKAEVELQLAGRIPNLKVAGGVRYFNETDDTAFLLSLSMPLPIFDQNQGGIEAARLRAIRQDLLEDANRVQIRTAVAETHQAIDSAHFAVQMTRDQVLPGAEEAFAAAEEAFRQGKIGALDLFDAQRTLFEARRQLVDALISYQLSVIAGERLIGAPLHGDVQTTGEEQ
jgi:cobalt-zinc-cadmium efflux system outer membrane protein